MKLIFTLIFSAFFAVYGIYFFKFHGPLSSGQDIWGQFGDFVGGTLNPILSFITIYLLYKTIVLQQESLQKTQESLALSRDSYELSKTELSKSREFLDSQNQLIGLQKFEGAFYEISKLIIEAVNTSKHIFDGVEYIGSSGLDILLIKLLDEVEAKKSITWTNDFFDNNENFYSLIKLSSGVFSLINKSSLTQDEKNNYLLLLASILPSCLINAICFIRLVGDWPLSRHFEDCGFYEIAGIAEAYDEILNLEKYRN
ncbi:hypothetical protein BTW15_23355 [Pseudomonas syringae pv. tomato]|uniref:Phage abortive infection protein n=4 Tax=Pseudomonas syringae group TaxID=136849 RepID=A0AAW4E2Y1_PSESX|nr:MULTISPECIES: hypothetical protein [Pseudomonas syringae group]EEB56595.1 hypothetical protein PSPTOT1_2907 [Pseudomonas syringae pv. tomato T1]KGK93457.1 hypothetical protein NB04_20965 [Pseudomonas syringae pv. tomato]KUR42448.1 hypothetical protein PST407_05535 [Pseudomonas syringae pv. tomato]KUR45830.1 hypothetical protein PSTA9_02297 [Pseudomonas syringae pv. tomato]MBI6699720.1 hypothetical protein [Pseudomonas syringae]